jgi:hypothetical protein
MQSDARTKRRESNRAHYLLSKQLQDAVLLRIDKGDLARLDRACHVAGLSRSAFATLYLLPMANALSARFDDIETARAKRGISLETFFARAIDASLSEKPMASPSAASTVDEFDALFGAPSNQTRS